MKVLDSFYLKQEEPVKSVYLTLKDYILKVDPNITNELKYGMPFFCYDGKMFCYLWFHKKYQQPYLGLVEGCLFEENYFLKEKRSRMKIMLINPNIDLPFTNIEAVIQKAISIYKLDS